VQLYNFQVLHEAFSQNDVGLYSITAEPGGEDLLKQKLSANGLPDITFKIFSDPSWSLMTLEPREQIFVENPSHPFLLEAGQFESPYRMCQPALVIVNNKGEVIYWWSWTKLRKGSLAEDGVLPNARDDVKNTDGNTHDVRWRPVPEDILLKLTEGGDLSQLRVENQGFPAGKDHLNVKKLLKRDSAQAARDQLEESRKTGKRVTIFNEEVKAMKQKSQL